MSVNRPRRAVMVGLMSLPWAAQATAFAADVRDFGAIGDGVTDDTASLQRAIERGPARLFVPPGRYLVRAPLYLRSGQTWQGAGAEASVLITPQEAGVQPFNLLTSQEPVRDIEITDLGLAGSLTAQSAGKTEFQLGGGQRPFGIYLRAGLSNFALRRCRISDFGIPGKKVGGGVALGSLPHARALLVENIAVQDCVFSRNGNVPGVYIAAGLSGGQNIAVTNCRFTGVGGNTPPQNAVYILGTSDGPMRNVRVADCGFLAETPLDTGVELNWVEDFELSDLSVRFRRGAEQAVAVLLRDGTRRGLLRRITLDTEASNTFGLALVDFGGAPHGPIDSIVIEDFTASGPFERAIALDRGSQSVLLRRWQVAANTEGGPSQALRFAACQKITALDGQITAARYPVLFAGQSSAIQIARLQMENCGGSDSALISRETDTARTDALTLADIAVISPRPGTTGLIDPVLGNLP